MIRPATSGVSLPDRLGDSIRGWRIAYYSLAGVVLVALLGNLVLLISAAFGGYLWGVVAAMLGEVVLLVALLVVGLVLFKRLADQRTALADALTLAGHPGVDVRRLQRGKAAPSPQGVELRLRKERDDAGARWLLVDAYGYATQAGLQHP